MTVQDVFSNVEFRRANNVKLFGFNVVGTRGGNGGGGISSRGGSNGAFGVCLACHAK